MKYGEFIAKYNHRWDEYDFPGRTVCREMFTEIIKKSLDKISLIFRAYNVPGKNRVEVKFVKHLEPHYSTWQVKFPSYSEIYSFNIPQETLDKLNIIPEDNVYFWIEVWQNGKRKA